MAYFRKEYSVHCDTYEKYMIDKNSKLYFDKEKYIIKTKNNTNVLIDNEAFVMLKANNTALQVLNLMNGENTVADIINRISVHYNLPESVTEEFVQSYIENLYKDGFAASSAKKSEEKHNFQNLNRIYLEINNREKGELSLLQIKELFEKIEKKGKVSPKVYVYVKGAAPLEHSEIGQIISYLGEKEYTKVWLFLNAGEVDDQKIGAFIDKITALVIMVKHVDEVAEYKKTQKENMQAFNCTLSLCLEHKVQVYLSTLAVRNNVEELTDMHQYAYEFEMNGFILENPKTRAGIGQENKLKELYKKEYHKILKNNNFMNSWRNNRIQNDTKNFYFIREEDFCFRNNINVVKRKHCGMGVEEISIDAAGSLYPCHLLHCEAFKYANLEQFFDSSLYDDNVVNEKCHDCDVWMLCLGGCRAENYYKNEKIDTPRENCEEKSKEIEGYLFSI